MLWIMQWMFLCSSHRRLSATLPSVVLCAIGSVHSRICFPLDRPWSCLFHAQVIISIASTDSFDAYALFATQWLFISYERVMDLINVVSCLMNTSQARLLAVVLCADGSGIARSATANSHPCGICNLSLESDICWSDLSWLVCFTIVMYHKQWLWLRLHFCPLPCSLRLVHVLVANSGLHVVCCAQHYAVAHCSLERDSGKSIRCLERNSMSLGADSLVPEAWRVASFQNL